jgi:aminoglycoside phosphotransferase (APT) family kinase protein
MHPHLRQRVADALGVHWPNAHLVDLKPLEGGHSGLTLLALVRGGAAERVVIKLAPPGRQPVGRHDVLRQARLLSSLQSVPGVAVPPVLFTSDGDPPLFAMGWVEGEALEPVMDAPAQDCDAETIRSRALGAARLLAALHSAPIAQVAARETPVLPAEELDRWRPTMSAIDPTLRPRAPHLERLLERSVPEPAPPSVLHGDYRLGNILCEGPTPRAIIDWEIWSVGDPRVDLGWFLVFCSAENLPGAATPVPGMPSAETVTEEYEHALGGRIVDRPWFDALARFKMAAIMGHNLKRHREGRYHDPYQERLPPTILSLVDQGINLLGG